MTAPLSDKARVLIAEYGHACEDLAHAQESATNRLARIEAAANRRKVCRQHLEEYLLELECHKGTVYTVHPLPDHDRE